MKASDVQFRCGNLYYIDEQYLVCTRKPEHPLHIHFREFPTMRSKGIVYIPTNAEVRLIATNVPFSKKRNGNQRMDKWQSTYFPELFI